MKLEMPNRKVLEKYWDEDADRIYDETYEKIYKEHMSLRDPNEVKKGRHQWEAEALDLGTTYAGRAVDEYLFRKYREEPGG